MPLRLALSTAVLAPCRAAGLCRLSTSLLKDTLYLFISEIYSALAQLQNSCALCFHPYIASASESAGLFVSAPK